MGYIYNMLQRMKNYDKASKYDSNGDLEAIAGETGPVVPWYGARRYWRPGGAPKELLRDPVLCGCILSCRYVWGVKSLKPKQLAVKRWRVS